MNDWGRLGMMYNFKYRSLNDFIITGEMSLRTGPFGTQLKASHYTSDGTPVINVRNIGYGKIIEDQIEYIDEDTVARLSEHTLEKNDIVFGRKAAVDRHAFINDEHSGWFQGSDCIRLRISTQKINPRYLSYYFMLPEHRAWMLSQCSNGTIMASLNQKILSIIRFPLAERSIQDQIVNILSCLDDKIDLNNRINANLEAQAQAIFKSWFMDFETFRDGEFEDSEHGPIPKGWRVGALSEIGTIVGGATPSKAIDEYYTASGKGISWITPKDLSITKNKFISYGKTDITELGYKSTSTKLMPKGSVLFSSRAPIGYIAIADNELCTNQGFKSVVPKEDIGTEFVYYTLHSNLGVIKNLGSGSTFKEVSGSIMKNVRVLIPDMQSIRKFSDTCSVLFKQQKTIEYQNHNLRALRDTLLPKLMNGEIAVPVEVGL